MEPALTRIEREYVVKSMGEEKPDLLLVCGSACRSVASSEYSVQAETLSIHISLGLASDSRVRVYFSHRKRGIYFDSKIRFSSAGQTPGILIGDRMFKEPASLRGSSFPVLYLVNPQPFAIARPVEWFPTEPVFPDPLFFMERKQQIEVLSDKLGLSRLLLPAVRILEYLAGYTERNEHYTENCKGILLFADEQAIGFTLSKDLATLCAVGDEVPFVLEYVNRRLRFTALCSGIVPMDQKTNIVTAVVSDMQEEDKRFIHERVYSSRYK